MTAQINVGGGTSNWKTIKQIFVNVGGGTSNWKPIKNAYVYVTNQWKLFFSSTSVGSFSYSLTNYTSVPVFTGGISIYVSDSINNFFTTSWSPAYYANGYSVTVSGVANYGPFFVGNSTSTVEPFYSSGYEYATVTAYNSNMQGLLSWTAATGAASYSYLFWNGSSYVSGVTTNTYVLFNPPANSTATVYYVNAWSGANATGDMVAGTPIGATSVTMTPVSSTIYSGGFYLSYYVAPPYFPPYFTPPTFFNFRN